MEQSISDIYPERELIQRAIANAKPITDSYRWVMVKRVFGTGRAMSERICWKYGFDPDKVVKGFLERNNA